MKFSIAVMVLLLSAASGIVGHAAANDISIGENNVISIGSGCASGSGVAAADSGSATAYQVIMAPSPAPIQLRLIKDVRMRAQTFSSFPFEGAKGFRNAIRDKAMARDIRLASGEYQEYGSIYRWYIWSTTERNYTTGRPEETFYLGVSIDGGYRCGPPAGPTIQNYDAGNYDAGFRREEIIRERFFKENSNGSYADINRGNSPSTNN